MSGEKIGGYETKLTPRAEQKRKETIAYDQGWNQGESEKYPDNKRLVEYILSTIQLEELKDTFLEQLKTYGVPIENANIEVLNNIFTRPIEKIVAGYTSFTNHIIFSTDSKEFSEVKQLFSEEQNIPTELLLKMQLSLVHELCHAFSRVRISATNVDKTISAKAEVGYHVTEMKIRSPIDSNKNTEKIESVNSLESFDEGVTERIAEEIFLAYGRRVGMSASVEQFLKSFTETNTENTWRYSIYANEVDLMCEKIGQYVGVPKEIVWQSFKRGYFNKPELFDEEVLELFKETFGESFFEEYQNLGNKTPVRTLGEFDGDHGFSHPKDYAEKWLRYLGIPRQEV